MARDEKFTVVDERAKLVLLRELLMWRDEVYPFLKTKVRHDPQFLLGYGCLDPNEPDAWNGLWPDVILAAKELDGIGHLTISGRDQCPPEDWIVQITDAGADWIRVHDLLGEVAALALPTNAPEAKE